ncbi:MAG TPA: polysaccharide deacetylase family protein [Bacteroidales bacterium]|jgi:hypothetical protein|nr:polysaccharide deacetylase family protein [Bacteroidales bacterium]
MDTGTVRIYASADSPRLEYIAGFILGDILGLNWEVTTDKRKLRKHPVLNYSEENISGSFRIIPHPLLFEKGVRNHEIIVSTWKNLPVFFQSGGESDFPFDLFAASFFLVTRYEEYLEYGPDEHGRYPSSASVSYRNGFLTKPVIDLWVNEFARAFIRKIRDITFKRSDYSSLLTIDTDEPYAHDESLFRSLIRGVSHRHASGQVETDPYDVFDYLVESIKKNRCEARFFLPVGDRSKYDRNPSWKNSRYRELMKRLSADFITGIHPSYFSFSNNSLMEQEAVRYREITGREAACNRFHYLRLKMPFSYRELCRSGVKEDFSMGYPDEPGFRAGTARPFYFYDLLTDEKTSLMIYPFQVMDETLFGKKNLNPEDAMNLLSGMISEVKKTGGVFISIWHNTMLLDDAACRNHRKVFEFMLIAQANDNISQ